MSDGSGPAHGKRPVNRRFVGSSVRVAVISGLVGIALLLQESVLAYRFGVSQALAAFQVAFLWVSLLWNVLAGGTLLAVLIPSLVWARANPDPGSPSAAFTALSGRLLVLSALVSAGLAVVVPILYRSPVSGLPTPEADLAAMLFATMVPSLVLQTVSSIAQARLNVDSRFALAAFAPALPPLAAAAATLMFADRFSVLAPAVGILLGQFLWAATLVLALPRRRRLRLRDIVSTPDSARVRMFFRDYALLVAAALLLSGVFWADQATAAHLGAESIARLAYANRPVLLFSAIATIAVANVALPGFAEHAAKGNRPELRRQLGRIALWLGAISVVALPLWALMAPQIIAILYQRGAFSALEVERVADVHRWAITQVPFYLLGVLAWRMLNALKANGVIVIGTAVCFLLNLALNPPFASAWGEGGILAATSVAFAVWAFILVVALRRRLS